MEIKLNTNFDSVARLASSQPKASRPVDNQPAIPEFRSSQALESKLAELPDVRPDKLQEAKRLVGDPAYPPRETMQRLAALLAIEGNNGADTFEN